MDGISCCGPAGLGIVIFMFLAFSFLSTSLGRRTKRPD